MLTVPDLLFPARTRTERRALADLKAKGTIVAVGPRLWMRADVEDRAAVLRASWAQIVGRLFSDVVISHRTALEYKPTELGDVFLTSKTHRTVSYPGLQLRFVRGPGPLDDDIAFVGAHASSLPRALLENLSTTRGMSKTLPQHDLEARLERVLLDSGEAGLNALRDRARQIADAFSWRREMARLDALIGALLGTHRTDLVSEHGRARAAGAPFDVRCVERLHGLFAELRARKLPMVLDERGFGVHFRNKAFFEAYFSNYIEGTTFELSEAEHIVFERQAPATRPRDAHDITATFDIVSDPNDMRRVPRSYEELRGLLVERHAKLMALRPEVGPGRFKDAINRAGDTIFVHPDYVVGTLQRGVDLLLALDAGLPRAVFSMFLIADVHPFNDGNGRMARMMMNAELVAARSVTIIIPTAYRDEYIDTLRALTRQGRTTPVVDMLIRAQRFSNLDFADYAAVKRQLQANNWFSEPSSGLRMIV